MKPTNAPVSGTVQVTVRLPSEMLNRLDRLLAQHENADRSSIIREALNEFLASEVPGSNELPRAVKKVWSDAVVRAFEAEGIFWSPLSLAWFMDRHPIAARKGAVKVRIEKAHAVGGSDYDIPGFSWEESLSTPDELYRKLRAAVRERARQQATPELAQER